MTPYNLLFTQLTILLFFIASRWAYWVSGVQLGASGGVVRVHECEGLTSKKIIMRRNHIWKVLGHYSTPQFQKKGWKCQKIASKNGKTPAVRTVLFIEGWKFVKKIFGSRTRLSAKSGQNPSMQLILWAKEAKTCFAGCGGPWCFFPNFQNGKWKFGSRPKFWRISHICGT